MSASNLDLVLARLVLDPRGIKQGIDETNKALSQGQQGLTRFTQQTNNAGRAADIFSSRLLGLNSIASKVGTALGLAGIAGTAVFLLKDLAAQVVTQTDVWKKWSTAIEDTWRQLALGETPMETFTRKQKALFSGTGKQSVAELVEQLRTLEEKRLSVFSALPSIGRDPMMLQAATRDAEALTKAIEEVRVKLVALGISMQQVGMAPGGAGGVRPGLRVNLKTGNVLSDAEGAVLDAAAERDRRARLDTIFSELDRIRSNPIPAAGQIENLVQFDNMLKTLAEDAKALGVSLSFLQNPSGTGVSVVPGGPVFNPFEGESRWKSFLDDLSASLDTVNIKMQLTTALTSALAGAMASAFSGDTKDLKAFFADMLSAMVPVLSGLAAIGLAEGILANSPRGYLVAAVAGAGAVAAAAAARALGGGGESYGRPTGAASNQPAVSSGGGGGRGQIQVSVNVTGVMGIMDQNEFARHIALMISRAIDDGAPA